MSERYIATDEHYSAIYGVGDTPEGARADARRGDPGGDATYVVYPATPELVMRVKRDGGGPGDVSWTIDYGTADLAFSAPELAVELLESAINGNRTHVRDTLRELPVEQAVATAFYLGQYTGSGPEAAPLGRILTDDLGDY